MKERLTGAIILVALLVLLVPELLTGPEHFKMAQPAGTEGTQMRSYTIDLQDGAANRQPPASAPALAASDDPVAQATPEEGAAPPPVANVAPPVDDAARATGRPMGSGADASAAASEAPVAAGAKPGVATPPGRDDDKPRSAFGPSADAARAEAAKAASAKAAAAKAEAARADAARTEAAKEEAAKARAAKADAERAAAAKADTAKSAVSKGWAVQLGVFGSRDNAERLAKQVKGSGFPVLVNETSGKDGKKLYWVRVGPEAEQAAADALSAKLKAAGHRDVRVVSYP